MPARARKGMTLIEVMFAMIILTGVLLVLGAFSAKFSQANGQSHLVITANEIAAARMDEIKTQPTYLALDSLQTPAGKVDSIPKDNTWFVRITKMRQVGSSDVKDSVDYKIMTVFVSHAQMKRTITKSTAIAAY